MSDFSLLLVGRFLPGQVSVKWAASTRAVLPAVDAAIEQAWQTTIATPGVRLFDGAVARLESYSAAPSVNGDHLAIVLSPTSYRIVVGTNFANPQLADTYGPAVMANPLGVSTGLLTADGFWMMGRRNRSVAYYPARVHPFAGSLEVRDVLDVFDDVRRELREELAITPAAITQIVCLGVVSDFALRHPELVFITSSTLSRDQITAQLDREEHDAVWFTPAEPATTSAALKDADLTPVAKAALLLGGRERFGQSWFDDNASIARDI